MTQHRSSIPLDARFTPPPAFALKGDRRGATAHDAEAARAETVSAQRREEEPSAYRAPVQKPAFQKRAAIALAIMAVPAMAAPGDFGAMAADAPSEPAPLPQSDEATKALGFEQPGMSFPGSAFYYVAAPQNAALVALPDADPFEEGSASGSAIGSVIDAGPAAAAFLAGTGSDYARAKSCLAQAIWYEAASESRAGKRAVAQVVLNRVAHPSWPGSVCGVVYEGSQRSTGCQFSFTCDGSLRRRAPGTLKGASWSEARDIAAQALNGSVYAPIGHATHYHTLWVDPYWAKTLDPVGVIGAHRFYRNRGASGEKAAFGAAYAGEEPALGATALQSPAYQSAALASDTGAVRIAPEAILETPSLPTPEAAPSGTSAEPAKAKAPTAPPKRAASGQARSEFARAGRWKVNPAKLKLETKQSEQPAEPEGEAPDQPAEKETKNR